MHARAVESFAKFVFLDETVEEFRTDAEIVQEGVAFDGRSHAVDGLALFFRCPQIGEVAFLKLFDSFGEVLVSRQGVAARSFFFLDELSKGGRNGIAIQMRNIPDDRTAVNRRVIGVEKRKAVPAEQGVEGAQGVIEKMFMVDLIEGAVLHDVFHVKELNDEDPLFF